MRCHPESELKQLRREQRCIIQDFAHGFDATLVSPAVQFYSNPGEVATSKGYQHSSTGQEVST